MGESDSYEYSFIQVVVDGWRQVMNTFEKIFHSHDVGKGYMKCKNTLKVFIKAAVVLARRLCAAAEQLVWPY
jgi:hypothetical protein